MTITATLHLRPLPATSTGAPLTDTVASPSPRAPRDVAETGLTMQFLLELILKRLHLDGRMQLSSLSGRLKLPPTVLDEVLQFMRIERLVEITGRINTEADAQFQLTQEGASRAAEALQRNQYAGPAPVTLHAYTERVAKQSLSAHKFDAATVRAAFAEFIIDRDAVDQTGAALNSGRAVLIYGPAGSGKTFMAERLLRLLPGTVMIPYAITVDNAVIQVFDPLIHEPMPARERTESTLVRSDVDDRWVRCRRPFVLTGGELTLQMLDLQFDEVTRFYQAPPHVKANGGIFVVDDLGRQLVSPRELMNRWIVPLDRKRDYLTLRSGQKFVVPFDLMTVFSTNLRPESLADEAFLRRFGYKIHLGELDPGSYRSLFERTCAEHEVEYDAAAFSWLLTERHRKLGKPLLACYPRDLIGRVCDFAAYEGLPPTADPYSLGRAWDIYFVGAGSEPTSGTDSPRALSSDLSTVSNVRNHRA